MTNINKYLLRVCISVCVFVYSKRVCTGLVLEWGVLTYKKTFSDDGGGGRHRNV